MMASDPMDSQHEVFRAWLRIAGLFVLLVGLIFIIVGVGSIFSAVGNFERPRLFWCLFIGMPLFALGAVICKFAFMGKVTRYIANEMTPVGKDVANYMADGTKDTVRNIAAVVGQGLRETPSATQLIRCRTCNVDNDDDANFCKACGAPLAKIKPCPNCGEQNDPDARFCDNCGKAIGQ